jgi:hypothetical protein
MRACSDTAVSVLTVDALDATELSFRHIDISFGGDTPRGAYMQLCSDERVDECLGGGRGASVITMGRSLDWRDVVRVTVRRMQAGRRYGRVKIYNYAIREVRREEGASCRERGAPTVRTEIVERALLVRCISI